MKGYIAHTENKNKKLHLLRDHLKKTANKMEEFSCKQEYNDIFKITGYLHDFGKYQLAFQNYLLNSGPRAPHAAWGAGLARFLKLNEASFAIDGHHKGLPDHAEWHVSTMPFLLKMKESFNNVLNEFKLDTNITEKNLNVTPPKFTTKFEREFFTRYLFSALTDADWLDTEKHFNPEISKNRPEDKLMYDILIKKINIYLNKKPKAGLINQLRNEARKYALTKAQLNIGFFSLSLPTGLGKTLTSISWALEHAKFNSLNRIIIVLPYVNIIDQTAMELKKILGEDIVLEHHSSYNEEEDISTHSRKKLATENWEFPIIITTTVQFFESLFANKPSKCRKIHNISKAVVIFDEVQTLPKELITPTLTMLKNMNTVIGTSFLFCTATQPAFLKSEKLHDGIESIISLVEDPYKLYKQTKRVNFTLNKEKNADINDIVKIIAQSNTSVLVISNTKKKARTFLTEAETYNKWEKYYHLSTSMCPAHRKEVIKQIKKDDLNKQKIFLSSTQLIETGVDIDFPLVSREIAPLDSILQAAGRCNREGNMDIGDVIIFSLKDKTMPDILYSSLSDLTKELLETGIERIYQPTFFSEFYIKALKLYVDDDKKNINYQREKFNFKTISSAYKIIEQSTRSLFIWNYNSKSKDIYNKLRYKKFLSRHDFRRIQEYSVQVYESFLYNNIGMWEESESGLVTWLGKYNKKYGITTENMENIF